MLKLIEYGLLTVSLLVIVGLIASGSRGSSQPSGPPQPPLADDQPNPHPPDKSL